MTAWCWTSKMLLKGGSNSQLLNSINMNISIRHYDSLCSNIVRYYFRIKVKNDYFVFNQKWLISQCSVIINYSSSFRGWSSPFWRLVPVLVSQKTALGLKRWSTSNLHQWALRFWDTVPSYLYSLAKAICFEIQCPSLLYTHTMCIDKTQAR